MPLLHRHTLWWYNNIPKIFNQAVCSLDFDYAFNAFNTPVIDQICKMYLATQSSLKGLQSKGRAVYVIV